MELRDARLAAGMEAIFRRIGRWIVHLLVVGREGQVAMGRTRAAKCQSREDEIGADPMNSSVLDAEFLTCRLQRPPPFAAHTSKNMS